MNKQGGITMNKQAIMDKYKDKGITPGRKYARSDITEKLRDIANILIREAYGKEYTDKICLSDLRKMIIQKSEKKALYDSQVIETVSEDLKKLESRIKRYEAGDTGEEKARKALQMFHFEHCKLHSVFLSNKNGSAEYDDLVITPRGIFIIEVKNICTDILIKKNGYLYRKNEHKEPEYLGNLGEAMERKRFVLWGALSDDIKENICVDDIHLVLLYVGRGVVDNDLDWVDVCYSSNICRYIEGYNNEGRRILLEVMEKIYRRINSVNEPNVWELGVDIDKYAEHFSNALNVVGCEESKSTPVKVRRKHLHISHTKTPSHSVRRNILPQRNTSNHKNELFMLMTFFIAARTYMEYNFD